MNYFIKINGLSTYFVQSPNPRIVLRVVWLNWPQLGPPGAGLAIAHRLK